jgi:hypothetical protein
VLAPCAALPGGALSGPRPGLDSASLQALKLRAAAAAIAGATLDLEQLARPAPATAVPPPPPASAAAPTAAADQQRQLAWLAGTPADTLELADTAFRWLAELLARPDRAVDAALREGLAKPEVREHWAMMLPDDILARLLYRVAPARARVMLDMKTVLQAAWRLAAPSAARANADSARRLARVLLTLLADDPPPAPRALARRMLDGLADGAGAAAAPLLAYARSLARQGGYANVGAALRAAAPTLAPVPPVPPLPPLPPAPPTSRRAPPPAAALAPGTALYIANAGLVLVHPFLPRLFQQLGLLGAGDDRARRIDDIEQRSRAVHLLQYLVDGRCDASEPELALNKLLCGIPLEAPVAPAHQPDAADLAQCDQLLQAVIGNWPNMQKMSPAALRETFFQRDGRLLLRDGKWTVTVSRKTVDVLVDQIAWGFAIVLHPWMPTELTVAW